MTYIGVQKYTVALGKSVLFAVVAKVHFAEGNTYYLKGLFDSVGMNPAFVRFEKACVIVGYIVV